MRSIQPIASMALRQAAKLPVPMVGMMTPSLASARISGPSAMPVRALSMTASLRRDDSWVKRGTVLYDELKPYTEAPSGKITIIDVREPNEVAQGMIPAAVNVPLSEFSDAFDPNSQASPASDFERRYSFRRPAFDDSIVFYCRSGRRSQQALETAQQRGWWNVRNYQGSWIDWVEHEKDQPKKEED
ncbi:hypothetical protein Malapachy_0874 [Malassezia pachydermatis]|uniref:Rhodanese domain-containing protein n=1 Tax=Malassezia pachydermatis TaxID=77020 RepID=A0A0N0RSF9_9BASI|nr:hypothetical protein Malapachy_0874 [Malassezia pachydermatis]KOS15122.1 hypothetical protein Malapachy_0874 [Malassezia pachydermatis]